MRLRRASNVLLVVGFTVAGACGSSSNSPIDGGGGTIDAPVCAPLGGACTATGNCCSGVCNTTSHTCTQATTCLGAGAPCGASDTCCTGACTNGECPVAGCVSNGSACAQNGDCCSSNCASNVCAPAPGATCLPEGNTCSGNGDCCSQTCSSTHVCVAAGGALGCRATGDVCFAGADCCSGLCTGATATTAGTCSQLASFGSGGCTLDGEPCSSGTTCCSRICAAIPGGGNVCQLAAGCRLTGDVCHATSDCCGAPGTGLPGAGEVTCNIIAGTDPPLGTCSNPTGNEPEGDVCGENVNARHDCADCLSPKIQCCKLDSLGVPRCYGGSSATCPTGYTGVAPCCIMAGQACTFSDECCGGVPCIPGPSGSLVCSGQSCIPENGVCTATGDCCTGLECIVPIGQPSGVCKSPTLPPPGDGGVASSDAAVCALGGQACGDTTKCCTGYVCDNPNGTPCATGEQDCSCFRLIP